MWCIGTGASANDISAIKLMFLCSTVLHVSGVLGLSGNNYRGSWSPTYH
jgi:hypothetical protein